MQNAAPVSALLVRAVERCAPWTTPGCPGSSSTCWAWRFQEHDTTELAFSAEAPLRPRAQATPRPVNPDLGPSFVDTLDWYWLNDVLNSVPRRMLGAAPGRPDRR